MIQDAVSAEVGQLLNVINRARGKSAAWDLEALERATRAALQRDGARLLQELLERLVSLLGRLVLHEDLARFQCRLWLRAADCYGNTQVAVSVPNRPCNAENSGFLNPHGRVRPPRMHETVEGCQRRACRRYTCR